ncbi:type IV conjugative transfer system lipoprotein TraV [Pantoea ananatis]|uniref:type IV conjugative transfer system lipoprotein TraV n=1 Tax=Pantoea ananas TaxID=553 RepID=UPI00031CF1CE|nr:type IV conjugative transfer system lipoprotein TraV [Pantoea ananatis]
MQKLFACTLLCASLTGCAGMNTDFDCNKTATDQCLSMSEASHLAAQHKSLDDLSGENASGPKPAAEPLAVPANIKSTVSPDRRISVAGTATAPHTGHGTAAGQGLTSPLPAYRPVSAPTPEADSGPGEVDARRTPDVTQRLWIAPWVDDQDSFHQPAVVEFVKNRSRWDQDYRVISEGQ